MHGRRSLPADPVQELVEMVLAETMAEQRRGFVMYMWAARILETQCQATGVCTEDLPHTTAEYEKVFRGHLRRQLDLYNLGIERMILGSADFSSRSPDILPPYAESIFARADLFTAANLDEHGLYGRVISMGDVWNREVRLGSMSSRNSTVREIDVVPNVFRPKETAFQVNWWQTQPGSASVYDRVAFSSTWKVHRYRFRGMDLGEHTFRTHLLVAPETATVRWIDLELGEVSQTQSHDDVLPFGSFTAIERAGGGYALFERASDWQVGSTGNTTGSSGNIADSLAVLDSADPPHLGIDYQGKVSWDSRQQRNQRARRKILAVLVRMPLIKFAEAKPVTFHVAPDTTEPIFCPKGECISADTDPRDMLFFAVSGGGLGVPKVSFAGRVGIVLGGFERNEGVVLRKSVSKT